MNDLEGSEDVDLIIAAITIALVSIAVVAFTIMGFFWISVH